MKKIENIFYRNASSPSQALDVYLPDAESFPVFVYFHGGGIVGGDKAEHTFFADLIKNGVAIVSANYRLYPEASYPDFIRDAAYAVAWAKNHMSEYGNPTAFFVGGSSAGAYLSQMLCFDKKYLAVHGIDADALNGYILDAGQPTVHFNVLVERGLDSRRVIIDEAAPIYHITENRTYAPMQIFVSENDMQNRPEQTGLLVSTLNHLGCDMSRVDYRFMKDYTHCGYTNQLDDNGNSIFAPMIWEFIKKYK